MKIITIPQKQSNCGSIHDIASDQFDREISVPANATHIIILSSFYGGAGYSTHTSAEAAAKKCKALNKDSTSYEVFDANGKHLDWDRWENFRNGNSNEDLA